MITFLSTPETLTNPTKAIRFLVELASVETELDSEGYSVPKHFKTIDVCVTETELIAALLLVAGHLEGYGIVASWVPEDCDAF